jgi:signal transduction histidine kinase
MIEAHAVQAAIALEFDRVREELRRAAVVQERRRVGQDLHERVIQMLFGIGLTLQSLEGTTRDASTQATLRSAVDSLDRAIRDLRRYVFDLGPNLAVDRGLGEELGALVADLVAGTTLDLTVDVDPAVSGMVTASAGDILQIAREAVSNVVRHAEADHCLVRLRPRNGQLVLEVADDGTGIPDSSNTGHGLRNMRSRAADSGARVEIRRNRPKGTIVQLTLPIQ